MCCCCCCPLEEMHGRYDHGHRASSVTFNMAFAVREATADLAEAHLIETALSEYYEYRASIGEGEGEPVPQYILDVDRITELLG